MDVVMPQLGETVKEGTVTAWRKKVGERVEKDEPLFEVNTDKVDMDVPSPATGVVRAILVPEGATVRVGERLAVVEEEGKEAGVAPGRAPARAPAPAPAGKDAPPPAPARPEQPSVAPRDAETRLSPVVRKLLAEHGLEPAAIKGTGASGRITRDDVLAHVAQRATAAAPQRKVVPFS